MRSTIITSVDPPMSYRGRLDARKRDNNVDMWRDDGAGTLVVTMDGFGTTEVDDSNAVRIDAARALHPEKAPSCTHHRPYKSNKGSRPPPRHVTG